MPIQSLKQTGTRRLILYVGAAMLCLLGVLSWLIARSPQTPAGAKDPFAAVKLRKGPSAERDTHPGQAAQQTFGPRWKIGANEARFTLTLFADFECPHCKTFFPDITAWVEQQPDTQLQWHHTPLAIHEPAASQLAMLAECSGQAGGDAGYWQAAEWIYAHTQGNGQGLPEDITLPKYVTSLADCGDPDAARSQVASQSHEAMTEGITATPALQIRDNATGRTLRLQGPLAPDTLLSALDLAASSAEPTAPSN